VGKRKGEGRMEGAYVKADEGESENLVVEDWAGVRQESVWIWLMVHQF
jgi:hypothetical protein